jgi:hypothetical protein
LLEDCRRIAYEEAQVTILRPIIDGMSDGISEWLESLKKPPHIAVWSDEELLVSSGAEDNYLLKRLSE